VNLSRRFAHLTGQMPGSSSDAGPIPTGPPPDFAVVGAPKCGTTALYIWLAAHPGIAMSARKEPCFWSRDIATWGRIGDPAAYAALWHDAPAGALRGEASPVYLQSQVAIRELLAARPDARLIAMIRNPVEMVASRHANLLVGYQEDVVDLEAAWRLQARRAAGEALPPQCAEPALLQYRAFAAIGDQLERFFVAVPAAQRMVIVYDDFGADPRAEYLRVLALLGLADDGRTGFDPVHRGMALRWSGLPGFLEGLSRRPIYRPARRLAHAVGLRPGALLHKANLRTQPRPPLSPGFERELIAEFLPQVETVERLLDRDLGAWKVPRV
jgi:hypothetical protein